MNNDKYEETYGKMLNEAEEINFKDLSTSEQKHFKSLEKLLSVKTNSVFDGIHGKVISMDIVRNTMDGLQLEPNEMKNIMKTKNFRFIRISQKNISIHF